MMRRTSRRQRFSADRFFFARLTDSHREGWYYQAREGAFGPFPTKQQAQEDLERLKTVNPAKRRELFRHLGLRINHLKD